MKEFMARETNRDVQDLNGREVVLGGSFVQTLVAMGTMVLAMTMF